MFVLSTNRKGAIAETAIAAAATKLGIPVLRPIVEHARYDLAFEIGDQILRVQCKWGALDEDGALIKVRVGGSWLSPTAGYVRSSYGADGSTFSRSTAPIWTAATFCRSSSSPGARPSS